VERITLANRFVNYADAASVFPLVQAIAFSVALSEPDIRCSIADIWLLVALGNIVFSVLLTVVIVIFRRAELVLRQEGETDKLVLTYLQRLQTGRFVIIWLACAFVVLSAYTAILDPLCRLS